MRKVYLLIDGTKDENFLRSELPMLNERYDLTVVNFGTTETEWQSNIRLIQYKEIISIFSMIKSIIRAFLDFEVWKEIARIIRSNKHIVKRIKFIFWFYIEAQKQYYSLNKQLPLSINDDAIIYCYWNFVHCFAVTSNRHLHPSIKIIARMHGYDLFHYRMTCGWQPFKQIIDHNLDKIVFAADYSMQYYLNYYHIKKQDKHVASYLGTRNNYKIPAYKRKIPFRMVSCANAISIKRIHLIIEALALIEDINLEWIHFGDGNLFDELRNQAVSFLDYKENVKWNMCGNVRNEDILRYYAENQVDCFITTTSTEGGSPVSVMEAMSFGVPIIATSVTSLPQMIKENGILLPENPVPKDIAEAIQKIAGMHENELKRMREHSRKLWEENYVSKKNAERFIEEVFSDL